MIHYCFGWGFICEFTTEDKDELTKHEAVAHPPKYVIVGKKRWGKFGYKNIFGPNPNIENDGQKEGK